MHIELVADRFVLMPDGYAVDLATGMRVVLTLAAAGGASEQRRWAMRCDLLYARRHPVIARLVDYGAIGEGRRFEAWFCGQPWTGQADVAARAFEQATNVLEATGLSVDGLGAHAMRCSVRGPVLLPPSDAEFRESADRPGDIRSSTACVIETIERPAVAAIAELFDAAADCRSRVVSLWGPAGSGKSTTVAELARAARLSGLVPIAVDLLTSPLIAALDGRTLFIVNRDELDEGWDALLNSVLRSPRPHVWLTAGIEEAVSVDGIALKPLSVESLVNSVRPVGLAPALTRQVERAAERARGLPGRFAALLWRRPSGAREVVRGARAGQRIFRAAEQPAAYGLDEQPPALAELAPAPAMATAWAGPGEMASLRRRMEAAIRLLAAGRHAPGDRALRQAIGALVRRGDWTHAARGAAALATSLLKRGRAPAARTVLDDARNHGARGGADGALLDVATIAGHAWIDLARLDEAESVLTAAMAAARAHADSVQIADAALGLARCLFWRGRYAEADAMLTDLPRRLPECTQVRVVIAASRQAVGLRDLARAVSAAADAVGRAQSLGDPDAQAAAACASAFAHLAVGDLDAVERDVAACVLSARAARAPLRAIRARVLLVENERRRLRRSAAASMLRRFARIDPANLPPIVRARCQLLGELLKADVPLHEIVAQHARSSGLMALRLFASDASGLAGGSTAGLDTVVDGLVGILHACQNADDETAVLLDVCARLRKQIGAAAVAFVGADGSGTAIIASDGARIDANVAKRALDAGVVLAPHRIDDRIEAAVPVRYGGATLGALTARWSLGTTHTLSGAATMLTMSAAAAAPAVAAASDRRRGQPAVGSAGLLGVSAAMADVRRAVERAASAPFCVLIEGESGCGKELVARAVHRGGPRRDRSFCTLNCAALPDDLVESELFGHARGAFTGAIAERPGVFEEAHGGTLLLDEIGELSLRAQAKVLRVIQEGELRRLGENVSRRVDVRILSATNRDLRQEVGAGRFRLDLLYRLDVLRIAIPPLRDRREDIAELVEHIWLDAARRVGSHATLASATVAALARYDWPGNVRELQNVLAALAVRTPKRGVVAPTALPAPFGDHRADDSWRLDEARRIFDARFVRAALVRTGGHRSQAARELGVTRQGLTKLMLRLGIADGASAPAASDVRGGVPSAEPTIHDQRLT